MNSFSLSSQLAPRTMIYLVAVLMVYLAFIAVKSLSVMLTISVPANLQRNGLR